MNWWKYWTFGIALVIVGCSMAYLSVSKDSILPFFLFMAFLVYSVIGVVYALDKDLK